MLAQPLPVAQRAYHGAELRAPPADFGQATVVGIDAQFRRAAVGAGPGLHVGTGETVRKRLAARLRGARQRIAIAVLQVDGDRARGAAEAAEQLALAGEGARVREADHDLVAHDALQFADVVRVHHARAQRAAARPQVEIPVAQLRTFLAVHVGAHALQQDRGDLAVHPLRAHAGREVEEGVDGRALHRRQVVDLRHQQRREQGGREDKRADPAELARAAFGGLQCPVAEARPEPVLALLAGARAQPAPRGCRQHGDGDQQRDAHRDGNGQGEIGKKLALHVLHEDHRQEHRHRRQRGSDQRAADLARALQRRARRRQALLAQAHDVLGHHHRGIHHHAHREREAGQRDDVEAAPGQLQHDEGGQQRNGNGAGDQRGGAHIAQEPPQAAHGQQHADGEAAGQQAQRTVDEDRGIETLGDVQAHRVEFLLAHVGDDALDLVQRVEHVGAALAQDAQADGGIAVLVGEEALFGPFDLDSGDIGQSYRAAIAPGEDQVAQRVG